MLANFTPNKTVSILVQKAVLSQGESRDAAVNFNAYIEFYSGIVRAVSLSRHSFLVGLCVQTALNHLSTRKLCYRKDDSAMRPIYRLFHPNFVHVYTVVYVHHFARI